MKALVWTLVALCCGLSLTGPIIDPDLWWHIVVGKWILAHGAVPVTDHWNAFGAGQAWRAYSWSNEIVLALAEQVGGPQGLIALKMLLGAVLAVGLSWCFSRLANSFFVGLLLGIFALASCYNHFTLRPQSFVWILFVGVIVAAESVIRGHAPKRAVAALFLLMVLWANSHITTVLGLAALGSWTFARIPVRTWLCLLLIAFSGTLVTPYVGGEWLTFLAKTSHPLALRAIAEFQPATIMQYSTGFLLIGLFLLSTLLAPNFRSCGVGPLLGVLGFSVAGLAVVKFLPFGVLYVTAVIALMWNRPAGSAGAAAIRQGVEKLQQVLNRIPEQGAAFLLVCIGILSGVALWRNPIDLRLVPKEAVDFIESRGLLHPVITDFGRGGYMMYRFSDGKGEPLHKVFIDGRTNVVPADVMNAYMDAERGREGWERYFDMVQPQTVLWSNQSPIIAILKATGKWCEVLRTGTDVWGYVVMVNRPQFETLKADWGTIQSNCR
ncbi:MAG: hypothetical protein QY326_00880 [Bdellovibrionota bacterium]|nr:MAG: hypothetical protein QY326_00880 [Bdellovibrionota bacterium]